MNGTNVIKCTLRIGANVPTENSSPFVSLQLALDQGYGRGGTPVFSGVFEPVARVTLYLPDENGLDTCFGAA